MKLNEYTASELINNSNRKGRKFSPSAMFFRNFNRKSNTLFLKVGKYTIQIALPDLKILSKDQGTPEAKVELAVTGDVKVFCSCADYQYRFAYVDTQLSFGIYKENRPADITNPNGKGTVCKHLVAALTDLPMFVPDIADSLQTESFISSVIAGKSPEVIMEQLVNNYGIQYLAYLRDISQYGSVASTSFVTPTTLCILIKDYDLGGLESFVQDYPRQKFNVQDIVMEIDRKGDQFLKMTVKFSSPVNVNI